MNNQNNNQTQNDQTNPKNPYTEDGLTFEIIEHEQIGDKKIISRGIYLIPNAITTLSLLSGFISILASTQGQYDKAATAIILSAFLDGIDGRTARLLNAQSPFGEQYDSLADLLAFGIAPAILIYSYTLKPLGRIGIACAFIYTACAAFRLARFNVQIGTIDKKYFIGLASPLAAILITSSVTVATEQNLHTQHPTALPIIAAIWIVTCGLLMVSNLKYNSFKEIDKQKVPFTALIIALIIIATSLYNIPLGVLILSTLYALSGIITTLKHNKKHPQPKKK